MELNPFYFQKFMHFLIFILFCFLYAALNVTGAAIIKNEIASKPIESIKDYFPLLLNFKVIGAFVLIFISALVIFKALSMMKFSLVLPIANGINFGLTVIIGVLIFNDKINLYHIFGLSLILFGIILISMAEKINT